MRICWPSFAYLPHTKTSALVNSATRPKVVESKLEPDEMCKSFKV